MTAAAKSSVPLAERLALRPEEAAELIGASRSRIYDAIKAGELRTVVLRDGARPHHRITHEALREWLRSREIGAPL